MNPTQSERTDFFDGDELLEHFRDLMRTVSGNYGLDTRTGFLSGGGDSLSAVKLIAEIKRFFGVSIPLEVLENDASAEDLFQLIGPGDAPPCTQLELFNYAANDQPNENDTVLCLPGIGGSLMQYRSFVNELCKRGLSLDVWGLKYPSRSAPNAPRSIQESAIQIASELEELSIAPKVVVGYSYGGMVALELTNHLPTIECVVVLGVAATRDRYARILGHLKFSFLQSRQRATVANALRADWIYRMSILRGEKVPLPSEKTRLVYVAATVENGNQKLPDGGWGKRHPGRFSVVQSPTPHNRMLRVEGASALVDAVVGTE